MIYIIIKVNIEMRNKMKMKSIITRFKALFYDWLFICGYLIILFIFSFILYFLILDGIPEFTNLEAQLIASFTSVIPIIIIFSLMEGIKYSSFGKRIMNLKIIYKSHPLKGAFIRNIFKFLPWQLGHMSTINGIYTNFNFLSIIFFSLSILLTILYVLMMIIRKDNRHLADIIAGSKVISC